MSSENKCQFWYLLSFKCVHQDFVCWKLSPQSHVLKLLEVKPLRGNLINEVVRVGPVRVLVAL
jgi:hypothetical protein